MQRIEDRPIVNIWEVWEEGEWAQSKYRINQYERNKPLIGNTIIESSEVEIWRTDLEPEEGRIIELRKVLEVDPRDF